jgi:hypothetical protein
VPSLRGIGHYFTGQGLGKWKRLVIDNGLDTTPYYPPLHIAASDAPSATAVAGDMYVDSTGVLRVHNGGGFLAPGGVRRIIGTSAATLTAADSGSVIMFNNATGYAVTLPPAAAGLNFRVIVNTTVSSGVARLACASGDFFRGTLYQGTDTTYLPAARVANGTTHLAWEGNGSTTSGIAGDWFDIVAVDDTIWQVVGGLCSGSGSEATFWKTS